MAADKFSIIGERRIYFNQEYYLTYAGGHRELPAKEQKEWNKTLSLPPELQRKEQIKIGLKNNPNVIPLKGKQLLEFIRDFKFVPLFDIFFEQTHKLKLTDIIVFESIKSKSYEIAMKNLR